MVYNLHITTDEAGALLELSDSLADQLEGVVEAFNHTIHPAGGYRIYETIHLDADGFVLEGIPFHTGHKIAHALRGSSSLAVVSITLGEDISRLIEQYNKEYYCPLKSYRRLFMCPIVSINRRCGYIFEKVSPVSQKETVREAFLLPPQSF